MSSVLDLDALCDDADHACGTLDSFAQLTTSAMRDLQHAEQLIAQERAQLLAERDAFGELREKAAEQSGASPAPDLLMLNVGGAVMRVDRATLTSRAHPVLAEVFSGAWDRRFLRDREGNIFLDVDSSAFVALHDILLSCERPGFSRRTLPSMQEVSAPLAALMAPFHLHGDFKHGPQQSTKFLDLFLTGKAARHAPALTVALERAVGADVKYALAFDTNRDGWGQAAFHSLCADLKLLIIAEWDHHMFGQYFSPGTLVALSDIEWHGGDDKWVGGTSSRAFFALLPHSGAEEILWLRADSSHTFNICHADPSRSTTLWCSFGDFFSLYSDNRADIDLLQTPGNLLKSSSTYG